LLAIFLVSPLAFPMVEAQNQVNVDPSDVFRIPALDGSINFAVNGTYETATLQDNTWVFTNLRLNGSVALPNFKCATENTDLTIYYCRNFTSRITLRYFAEGDGRQTFDLGLGSKAAKYGGGDWVVSASGNTFWSAGDKWHVNPDGSVTVNRVSGNVSVSHWYYMEAADTSDQPFYQAHSVAIGTVIAVFLTMVTATICMRTKEKTIQKDDNQPRRPKFWFKRKEQVEK